MCAQEEGSTALVQAIKLLNIDAVEVLLQAGADPNKATKKGVTPISAAAHKGQVAIMTLLLNGGAQVNLVNPSGSSALIQASHFGTCRNFHDRPKFSCLRFLLEI